MKQMADLVLFIKSSANMFMKSQLKPYGINDVPENCISWSITAASPEVLDLLDTFFSSEEIHQLWESQRGHMVRNNSFTMFHILELYKREGTALKDLNYGRQDLRFRCCSFAEWKNCLLCL